MSLIKNLISAPSEKTKSHTKSKDEGSGEEESTDKKLRPFVKTATDLQRLKLEKLMKNPEKPVIIPEQRREKDYMATVPTFVRNVMGSSAGAGSGEFHVYRHLRRKEYARQKNIQAHSSREKADSEFQQKLDDNRRAAEERTAKKRAKRLKKKQRAKRPREKKTDSVEKEATATESSDNDNDTSDEQPSSTLPSNLDQAQEFNSDHSTVSTNVEQVQEKDADQLTKQENPHANSQASSSVHIADAEEINNAEMIKENNS